ncbi:Hypothetical protein ETEE_p1038 (plasmid) [Edwardsiella anguillarum ET080813]|uniref:Uncharacterized protein n=1 Tax=Edwardsiella anguillarum ET080813 TaxID=667120 RepID=A0A076LZ44_9GAMM|nr:Hypothetical protein ETEE_p1038 [Edwardsiella anguillarum ET080813]
MALTATYSNCKRTSFFALDYYQLSKSQTPILLIVITQFLYFTSILLINKTLQDCSTVT